MVPEQSRRFLAVVLFGPSRPPPPPASRAEQALLATQRKERVRESRLITSHTSMTAEGGGWGVGPELDDNKNLWASPFTSYSFG